MIAILAEFCSYPECMSMRIWRLQSFLQGLAMQLLQQLLQQLQGLLHPKGSPPARPQAQLEGLVEPLLQEYHRPQVHSYTALVLFFFHTYNVTA